MADFEGRLACVIGADGTIARGYRIDKCEHTGTGDHTISWQDELTVGLLADAQEMRVRTYALSGEAADRPFHLAVFRD